ncbi:MAG: acyl-phosphate glycerol 3-phosphate acyltransferase [Chlorobi bacterium OLB5]|nr:MAG: acyl-phosphate glycerol 3-phosphate acyltransferase [Chlorobi bacterium OLB5]
MQELFTIENILVFVLCYVIGSIPTAYIIVKLKTNKDVTREGSGNVGTLNSFQVTKSKSVGIAVLLIDLLKGAIPVYVIMHTFGYEYLTVMLGACAVILGHNYPVWLKFKGGRGLAPGAGLFLIINYYIVIGWCIVWLAVFIFKKSVLIANTAATFSLPVLVILINFLDFAELNQSVKGYGTLYFIVYSILITLIILSRHTEVFKGKVKKIN